MRTGQYDGVSASGDATLRLIAGGDVAPVNTDLIPNYADVFPALKNKPWNSVDGKPYGIPHGRGANILMYRTDKVKPAPDSWGAVFDQASPVQGQGHGLRQPDLHRRRGAVPEVDASPTSRSPTRTSSTTSSSRPPSTCSRRSARTSASTGRTTRRSSRRSRTATRRSARRGRSSPTCSTADKVPVKTTLPEGGRDRVVGHLDDLLQGQAPELHVHVDEPHHLARRRTPAWRSGSGRRRRTRRPARRRR